MWYRRFGFALNSKKTLQVGFNYTWIKTVRATFQHHEKCNVLKNDLLLSSNIHVEMNILGYWSGIDNAELFLEWSLSLCFKWSKSSDFLDNTKVCHWAALIFSNAFRNFSNINNNRRVNYKVEYLIGFLRQFWRTTKVWQAAYFCHSSGLRYQRTHRGP